MADKQQPDWPPRASATKMPEGTRRRGSTGQLHEVRDGRWVRIYEDGPPLRVVGGVDQDEKD